VKLIVWPTAWEDYLHWQSEDAKMLPRLNGLLKECMRDPFRGAGKPEPLGGNLEHRADCVNRGIPRIG